MDQVERFLLFHTPGYRWMKANQNVFDKEQNINQLLQIICKTFRYSHLNKVVNGNWATDDARQQRRERWITDIKRQAEIISNQTNINYEKVLSLLYSRMSEELNR